MHDNIYVLVSHLAHLCGHATVNEMHSIGIKPGQAGILFCLNKHGAMSQRDLAEKVCITAPSVTVAVQKMEEHNLVVRETDSMDKRIVRINITKRGKDFIANIKKASTRVEGQLCGGMSDEEKKVFKRLLIQGLENMKQKGNING